MTEKQLTKIGMLHHSIVDAEYKLKVFTEGSWIINIQKFNDHDWFDISQGVKNEILDLIKSNLIKTVEDLKIERDNINLTELDPI